MTTPLPIQVRPHLRGGLESAVNDPSRMLGADGTPLSEAQWRTGVEIIGFGGEFLFTWGCASSGDKPAQYLGDMATFDSTIVGIDVICDGIGSRDTWVGDLLAQAARIGFDRGFYGRVAQILIDGDVGGAAGPNPSFNSSATFPSGFNPNAPGDFEGSMQGLLEIARNCSHSDVIFHIPMQFLPYALRHGVRWEESVGYYRYGAFRVIFDAYPNVGPAGTATAPNGTEFWMWMTGPIFVERAAQIDTIDGHEHVQNSWSVLVEQGAIVAFDPGCVGAVKVRI